MGLLEFSAPWAAIAALRLVRLAVEPEEALDIDLLWLIPSNLQEVGRRGAAAAHTAQRKGLEAALQAEALAPRAASPCGWPCALAAAYPSPRYLSQAEVIP